MYYSRNFLPSPQRIGLFKLKIFISLPVKSECLKHVEIKWTSMLLSRVQTCANKICFRSISMWISDIEMDDVFWIYWEFHNIFCCMLKCSFMGVYIGLFTFWGPLYLIKIWIWVLRNAFGLYFGDLVFQLFVRISMLIECIM